MVAKAKVIVKDRGLAAIQKVMRTGVGDLRVGVQKDKALDPHPGTGIPLGQLAAIHEFGAHAAGIPERPFIRRSFAKRRKDYEKAIGKAGALIFKPGGKGDSNRKKALAALLRVGNKMARDFQNNIKADNLRLRRIKPATLKARLKNKRPNPLQDSTALLKAITATVTPTRRG